MRVIIGGCGRVGSVLARRLSLRGDEVHVLDQDPTAFERLGTEFPGRMHRGKVFDRETLEHAGIEEADAFLALTSGDNSNIVSAIVARQVFRVPRVFARIYDPRRAEIYRRLGISAFSSVTWAVNEALAAVLQPELTEDTTFGDGEVRVVSVEVPPRLVGRTVAELTVAGEILPVAIVRSGRSFMPVGGTAFHEGDVVHVAVAQAAGDRLRGMVAP